MYTNSEWILQHTSVKNVDTNASKDLIFYHTYEMITMNEKELSRIIIKKEKKITQLEAILLAKNLYDEIEELEWNQNI